MPVTFLLGSKTDLEFAQSMADTLKEYGVESEMIVASAHKVPEKVVEIVATLNKAEGPMVVVTVVGMSNGLGGVVAGSCVHPVINCPPFTDHNDYLVNIHSSLQMPSDVPAMTVIHPKNAIMAALRILGESDGEVRKRIVERMRKVKGEY